jgi:UrcA family protein
MKEIQMCTKIAAMRTGCVVGAAAVASALFGGNVVAAGHKVTVAIHVSTQGLDLKQLAGARKFYRRLQEAARQVCSPGYPVALEPVLEPKVCSEKALGDAVRFAKVPLLTQVYLETHTFAEAAAHGIEVPAQMAAE